jgi:hypothetical protein
MRRALGFGALVWLLCVPGCLRTRIDLCAQVPPHPECAYLDAGRDAPGTDAPADAPSSDAGEVDAGAGDTGTGTTDAD